MTVSVATRFDVVITVSLVMTVTIAIKVRIANTVTIVITASVAIIVTIVIPSTMTIIMILKYEHYSHYSHSIKYDYCDSQIYDYYSHNHIIVILYLQLLNKYSRIIIIFQNYRHITLTILKTM